jgi:hypothetical protein
MGWYVSYYQYKSSVFEFTNNQINLYTQKAKEKGILWAMN